MPTIINRRDGKPTVEVLLEKGFTLIGRSLNADIRMDDPDDIEERASIVKVGEDFILNDLSPAGGMLVNGQAVKKRILNDRDLITIGEYRMTFHDKREKETPSGIEEEAAALQSQAELAKRPLKFVDPFREGPSGKSKMVIFALLGAIVVGISFASYQSYLARKAADAQAALNAKAADAAKKAEKAQPNAPPVEAPTIRNEPVPGSPASEVKY